MDLKIKFAESQITEGIQDNEISNSEQPPSSDRVTIEALEVLDNGIVPNKNGTDPSLLSCSQCNRQFQSILVFHDHLNVCKEGQLKCHICKRTFEHLFDLNNHLVCHSVERPYSCRLCGQLFIEQADLSKHLKTHGSTSNMNACKVCGKMFNRLSNLTKHAKMHKNGSEINNTKKFLKTVTPIETSAIIDLE